MIKFLESLGYVLLPLKWVEHDKQKHAALGIWIGGVCFMLSFELLGSTFFSVLFGLTVPLIIGVGIEWYQQRFGKGTYDKGDILATFLGGVFANVILLILWQV